MEELIKSPLNYTGGKFKLLPQILPLFPKDIDNFLDMFGGGANVTVNVKAKKVYYNDIESHVCGLLRYMYDNSCDSILNELDKIIDYFGLSNTSIHGNIYPKEGNKGLAPYNKENYLRLRGEYNSHINNPILFFTTLIYAFNNQIRYNSKGAFNMPVNKSDLNATLRKRIIKFVERLHQIDIEFLNEDFENISLNRWGQNDFVYCDPPYLLTLASYNERDGWNEKKERILYDRLDRFNHQGMKFALSNVIESKGQTNQILLEWSKKYNIIEINSNYNNCSYQKKEENKKEKTREILVLNY